MSQSQPKHKCPFIAGPMIQDERFFIGREDDLKKIYDSMTGLQPISISLVGEHRIGKSSLLYHFYQKNKNQDKYCVIFLDLQEAKCQTENSLYKFIADKFKNSYAAQNNHSFNIVWQNQTWDRITFTEAVEACKSLTPKSILPVLLIDKFDAVFQYPKEFTNSFYDNLHHLMNHSYMMMVAATLEHLDSYRQQHNLTSSFFNVGQTLVLKEDFSDKEVEQLLKLPGIPEHINSAGNSTINPALNPENQQKAKEWGGRKPYWLQVAAKFLWEAQEYNKSIKWARKQFKEQLRYQPKKSNNYPRFKIPKWLIFVFWDLPKNMGYLFKTPGILVNDIIAWLIGIVMIFVLLYCVLGFIPYTQFHQQLKALVCSTMNTAMGNYCK